MTSYERGKGEESCSSLPRPDIEMEDAAHSIPHRQISIADISMDDEEYQYISSEQGTEAMQDDWNDVEMEETESQIWDQEHWHSPFLTEYESRWLEIADRGLCESLSFNEIPWPTFIPITIPSDLTLDKVKAFVELPRRGMSAYDVISQELLRWHPDKFNQRILRLVRRSDCQEVGDTAMEVSRILILLRRSVS